jgi:hypothetical protein
MGVAGAGAGSIFGNRFNWSSYWLTRFPDTLTATVISDTRIDLAWTNNGIVNYTGVSIERSTDGVTYSEITTVAAGSSSYSNTGLTAGTLYYYRVRYYK